eukprot:3752361-Prorocentrum_lima.AAC.1
MRSSDALGSLTSPPWSLGAAWLTSGSFGPGPPPSGTSPNLLFISPGSPQCGTTSRPQLTPAPPS